jgi:hypothetical protein
MANDEFAAWLRDNPPPDLQEMVRLAGGYHLITEAMWADYDAAMADWQARRRDRAMSPARSNMFRRGAA